MNLDITRVPVPQNFNKFIIFQIKTDLAGKDILNHVHYFVFTTFMFVKTLLSSLTETHIRDKIHNVPDKSGKIQVVVAVIKS